MKPRQLQLQASPMKSPCPMSVDKKMIELEHDDDWQPGWWDWAPQSWGGAGWGWGSYGRDVWSRSNSWGQDSSCGSWTTAASPSPYSIPESETADTRKTEEHSGKQIRAALRRPPTSESQQDLTEEEANEFMAELEAQLEGNEKVRRGSGLRRLDTCSTLALDALQCIDDIAIDSPVQGQAPEDPQQHADVETQKDEPTKQQHATHVHEEPQSGMQNPGAETRKEEPMKQQHATHVHEEPQNKGTQNPGAETRKEEPEQQHATHVHEESEEPQKGTQNPGAETPKEEPMKQQHATHVHEEPQKGTQNPGAHEQQPEGTSSVPEQQQLKVRPAVVEHISAVPEDDSWRRNKKGELLSPPALYSRFYRSCRSRGPNLQQHVHVIKI